ALAVLAAGLPLLLTACGGSSSSSSSASSSAPAASSTTNTAASSGSASTPAAASSSPAKAGDSFAVGQTATVRFAPLSAVTKVTSTLKVTVESLEQGTLADFKGIQLNASEKAGTPDYVKVTIT